MNYGQQALMGATGVEMIVGLYDGALRSLYRAIDCVREGDVLGRRTAVKKVIDILVYLQARLRPDVGGRSASTLSDFYAAMFTLTLEASHHASVRDFEEVIGCVRNVRDAWAVVARAPAAGRGLPRARRPREEKFVPAVAVGAPAAQGANRWSA